MHVVTIKIGCACHLRNHHFNVKQVAAIRHYSALHTNHDVLQFNQVPAQWASSTPTPEMKEAWTRVSTFRNVTKQVTRFLNGVVTLDESWVYYSYSETKRASKVSCHSILIFFFKFRHSCLNRKSYIDVVVESLNPTRRAINVKGDNCHQSLIVKLVII